MAYRATVYRTGCLTKLTAFNYFDTSIRFCNAQCCVLPKFSWPIFTYCHGALENIKKNRNKDKDTILRNFLICIPLRRPKRLIFLGQGPVQGPREEVQGPCARATNLANRIGCKGHLDMCKGNKKRCKGLWCVQGAHILWPLHIFSIYWRPLHLLLWPLHLNETETSII